MFDPNATSGTLDGTIDLITEIANQLQLPPDALDTTANLLQLGLDSIDMMDWLRRFQQSGFRIGMLDLYRRPTIDGWNALLRSCAKRAATPGQSGHAATPWPTMQDGAAFALTDVQHAYLVGRSPQQPLGGVGCHAYQEFDGGGLDPERLQEAIRQLARRHPMLSAAFSADGMQRRLDQPAWDWLRVHDFRRFDAERVRSRLLTLREQLSHRLLDVESGRNLDFQLALLPGDRHRLFTNIDLLVADAASYAQLFAELHALVQGRELDAVDPDYDFHSYLAQSAEQSETARRSAQDYWRQRLPSLPPTPALPLAVEPDQIKQVRITRRAVQLEPALWQQFKHNAGACGLTPTMALATCYAAVLSRWSGQSQLLLNMTLFDRQPLHPAVAQMIADFTNVLLLDMCGGGGSFEQIARQNQDTFAAAYEHHDYSGVQVMRDLKKLGGHWHGAPVVFTSNLGRTVFEESLAETLGTPGWGVSQTPQVWIDHMALEQSGSVRLQWDCNDALFPPGLTQTLFDAYLGLVTALARQPALWRSPLPELMPESQFRVRAAINATDAPIDDRLLHAPVFAHADKHGDRLALVHGDTRLNYRHLLGAACALSGQLRQQGIAPGDRVGICMPKGPGQIVAALAILHAGAVYVPIAADQPAARIERICRDGGLSMLTVCADDPDHLRHAGNMARLRWQDTDPQTPVSAGVPVSPDQPAYIIYTSGSTGVPKGVTISHRGALNTCLDINRRCKVNAHDRILGLSALHFDLSVYDIFGVLGAGGALVLLDESQRRDPSVWCELIDRHDITLWNTVPALFDMLLTYADGFALPAPGKLRAALLSGDWIGLNLPARYRQFRADGRFIAMGGATEASIWSNAFEVGVVPTQWRSIPYGYPLANQRYRVADGNGRDCPDWVPGELWIGGCGVALGYFNDEERTRAQFVERADGRWYRTGDMGCYWPDGTLEFLGRRDKQVKIGGYRIELGEIEAALSRIDGIKQAIALALGDRNKRLVAFVTLRGHALQQVRRSDPRLPEHYSALLPPPIDAADVAETTVPAGESGLIADFLLQHLRLNGVDFTAPISADTAAERYGGAPHLRGLFQRWLDHLTAERRLQYRAPEGYRLGPAASDAPLAPTDPILRELAEALLSHHPTVAQIVRGQRPAHTLLDHPYWAPEQRIQALPGMQQSIDTLAQAIVALAQRLGRPVRVIEVGARSGLSAQRLLQRLDADRLDYLALDESAEMVVRARARLAGFVHGAARRWDEAAIGAHRHQADLVWSNNALHRQADPDAAWRDMQALAAPGALICLLEAVGASPQALVSVDLLQDAEAAAPSARLHDEAYWRDWLQARGGRIDAVTPSAAVLSLYLHGDDAVHVADQSKAAQAMAQQLPAYMMPSRTYFLERLPLTANGKVDQRALIALAEKDHADTEIELSRAPESAPERLLADLWQRLLDLPDIDGHTHFFRSGGDSLLATRLIGELGRRGYQARLGDLFAYPELAAFAATLQPLAADANIKLVLRPDQRHEPFDLTDVQQAYWVGRQPGFALGGIGSHFFMRFAVERLDLARFTAAWRTLIARHDMLRAVVRDGRQQILREVPAFAPRVHRVDSLDGAEADALHEALSHAVQDPAQWPVFDVQIAQDDGPVSHVYIGLDNLLLDGMSMQILFIELRTLYDDPEAELPPIDVSFRDYLQHPPSAEALRESQQYWRARIEQLPPAPQLPLRCDPADIDRPRFVRRQHSLPAEVWQALRAQAAKHELTPAALLLSAYAATLSAWSGTPEFCLNLTLFDRRPLHPHIDRVLGDFTTLSLLVWQPQATWRESAQRLQQRMRQDLAHREVSAIRVMREMAKQRGAAAASVPVVFTGALGYDLQDGFLSPDSWLKPIDGISQTPQTWLDHQAFESEGALHYQWDAVEALFDPEVLDGMFAQYTQLLQRLADPTVAWDAPLRNWVERGRIDGSAVIVPSPQIAVAEVSAEPAPPALIEAIRHGFARITGQMIAPRQNFFDAGASSLHLVQLHIALQRQGHKQLAVTDLFAHASPSALAAHLHGSGIAQPAQHAGRREQLQQRRARRERRAGQ